MSLRLIPAIVLSVVVLVACGGTTTSSPAPSPSVAAGKPGDKVVLSYTQLSADQMQPVVAQEAGFFARRGVDLELQQVGAGSTQVAALISGQSHIMQADGGVTLNAAASGAGLVVFATVVPVYPHKFEVPAGVKTKEDLMGKTVAVTRLGSSSHIGSRLGLRKFGLDPDKDVTYIQVETAAGLAAALVSGSAQGAIIQPPATMQLEAQGFHPLFDFATLGVPTAHVVLASPREWLQSHRDDVQKVVDAIVEGTAKAKNDRAFTIPLMKKFLKIDDQAALDYTYDFDVKEVFPAYPYPSAEQFSELVQTVSSQNPKVKDVNLATFIDASFVKSAEERGVGK